MTDEEFDEAQHDLLEEEPDFILDDGCELIAKVHAEHPDVAADVIGGGEQTTAGITRLEAMEEEGILQFPVYGVNDTPMKHFFDNVHGTGSPRSPTSPLRRTPSSPARTSWSVGYGYCGRGIARKARGWAARPSSPKWIPEKPCRPTWTATA